MKSNNIYLYLFLIMTCCSCHLLEPTHHTPYVEIIYTINGEQKQYQEDKHGGFGLAEKYSVEFTEINDGDCVRFAFTGCHQEIMLKTDEGAFIDDRKYYYDSEKWGALYFLGTRGCIFEFGWFSFHIVDDGVVCYKVSFDTEWSNTETGEAVNVSGSLYVYDKFYGKFLYRDYRHYIVQE